MLDHLEEITALRERLQEALKEIEQLQQDISNLSGEIARLKIKARTTSFAGRVHSN